MPVAIDSIIMEMLRRRGLAGWQVGQVPVGMEISASYAVAVGWI